MARSRRRGLVFLLPLLFGCTRLSPDATPPAKPEVADDLGPRDHAGSSRATSQAGDSAEISRSIGKPSGVVVFWPRIVPRSEDPATRELAARLQERAAEAARKAAGDGEVDVRPEPERVCPRSGCAAVTVGVLLTRRGDGCAAAALVSGSGTSPARVLPWAGELKLQDEAVPFREPPESRVRVVDYVACDKLVESLGAREGEIVAYIKGLIPPR